MRLPQWALWNHLGLALQWGELGGEAREEGAVVVPG